MNDKAIFGVLLLFFGLIICLSVVGSPIGLLMIGYGIMLLTTSGKGKG